MVFFFVSLRASVLIRKIKIIKRIYYETMFLELRVIFLGILNNKDKIFMKYKGNLLDYFNKRILYNFTCKYKIKI